MTNIDLSSEPTTNHIQDSQEEKETQNDFSPELEDAELIENEEVSEEEEYSKNSKSYEIPRPALTIDEASSILGKSIRALERSIAGKWGNKLPEGWHARKMKIDGNIKLCFEQSNCTEVLIFHDLPISHSVCNVSSGETAFDG